MLLERPIGRVPESQGNHIPYVHARGVHSSTGQPLVYGDWAKEDKDLSIGLWQIRR
jgi:hypothetical protein